MARREQAARLFRTVSMTRPSQWLYRLRRVGMEWVDRADWDVAWALTFRREPAALAGQVRWPHFGVGPGMPTAEGLQDGRLELLGRVWTFDGPDLPWRDTQMPALHRFHLHGGGFLKVLAAEGSEESGALARQMMRSWDDACPAPMRPAYAPYCISRRVGAWLSVFSAFPSEQNGPLLASLAGQVNALSWRLERDLGGNHLWENGVALLMAGYGLDCRSSLRWRRLGHAILSRAIRDQVLPGGGHAERSAMYHAVLLEGLLELRAVVEAAGETFPAEYQVALERMAEWLALVVGPSGLLPRMHDSTPGPCPDLGPLLGATGVADGARVAAQAVDGLVVLRGQQAEVQLDATMPGLRHQPGHQHASTLSLTLAFEGQRVIVDPGVCGYAEDPHRAWSRSTAAHSTLELSQRSSSEVWSSFRMGRRPERVVVDGPHPVDVPLGSAWLVRASHDGYRFLEGRPVHERTIFVWHLPGAAVLWIRDEVSDAAHAAVSRLPLHPDVGLNGARLEGVPGSIRGFGFDEHAVEDAFYAPQFGTWMPAKVAVGRSRRARPCGWIVVVGDLVVNDVESGVEIPAARVTLSCPDRSALPL
ncbi:MAG: alginate lyase family protein [Proteobacteria bacterium]|nr:alginate lyase family protein [Pseudomonadota bacterium]